VHRVSAAGTILITGANRGLGLGLVGAFVKKGWHVYAGCRRPAGALELTRLEHRGVVVVKLDVRDDRSVRSALDELSRRGTPLDIVVNNAGINPEPRDLGVAKVLVAQVADAFDVNALGALRVLQAAVPLLRRSGHPRVVNISSGAGSLAHNSATRPQPAYCISKAALNMLTRRAARELPDITIVSVSPGWLRTDMGGPGAALDVDEVASELATSMERLALEHSGQWLDRFGRSSEYAW
jgi:NAD(P)-dependent dehydrogenase (short-subunit alcohol dehydrogenase family)